MGREALGRVMVPSLGPWGHQCVALPAKQQKRRGRWGRDAGGVTPAAVERTKEVGWEGLGCRELHCAMCGHNWGGLYGCKQFPLGLYQLLPRQGQTLQASTLLPTLCFASHAQGGRILHIPSK